jgi:hypothetical protein
MVVGLSIFVITLVGCRGQAGAVKIDLGVGNTILVPVPVGFHPLGRNFPDFRAYIQERSKDILLEDFLEETDYKDLATGRSEKRNRELRIMSNPSVWAADFNEAAFYNKTAALRQPHYDLPSMTKSANDELRKMEEKNGGDDIQDSSPSDVEKLFDEPYAVGIMGCFTLTKNGRSSRNCAAQVELLVRRRIVSLYVMAPIHSDRDVEWVRATARSWTLGIHQKNLQN